MKRSILALTLLLTATAHADVSLPATFSDHMILQADAAVPVWGWAAAGEDVSVSIAGQTKSVKADDKGEWRVKLDPLKSGESTMMTVKGKNTITIQDVLVGEVWLCSGQSTRWSRQNLPSRHREDRRRESHRHLPGSENTRRRALRLERRSEGESREQRRTAGLALPQ